MTSSISESQIIAFCERESSAAFELRILDFLSKLSANVQHSGSYIDPITDKIRQFDLLVQLAHLSLSIKPDEKGDSGTVQSIFPIECKKVHPLNPVVVVCDRKSGDPMLINGVRTSAYSPYVWDAARKFHLHEMVELRGVSFSADTNEIGIEIIQSLGVEGVKELSDLKRVKDSDLYEKWSQPINSGIRQMLNREPGGGNSVWFTWVCPILVLPDESLWGARHTQSGIVAAKRNLIEMRISLDHKFPISGDLVRPVKISNMLIVTESGLRVLFAAFMKALQNKHD